MRLKLKSADKATLLAVLADMDMEACLRLQPPNFSPLNLIYVALALCSQSGHKATYNIHKVYCKQPYVPKGTSKAKFSELHFSDLNITQTRRVRGHQLPITACLAFCASRGLDSSLSVRPGKLSQFRRDVTFSRGISTNWTLDTCQHSWRNFCGTFWLLTPTFAAVWALHWSNLFGFFNGSFISAYYASDLRTLEINQLFSVVPSVAV